MFKIFGQSNPRRAHSGAWNSLGLSLALLFGWYAGIPSATAQDPSKLDCSVINKWVDDNISVYDPSVQATVPLAKANEDKICDFSFNAKADVFDGRTSSCWGLYYRLRQQVGETTADRGPGNTGTLKSIMMNSCQAAKKIDICYASSFANGKEMQECVAKAAKEIADAQRKVAAQALIVKKTAADFQQRLNKSRDRYMKAKELLDKVAAQDPAVAARELAKSTITVDGMPVHASAFGQRNPARQRPAVNLAGAYALLGGTPTGGVTRSALILENDAAWETMRRASGTAQDVELKANQRAQEYERIAVTSGAYAYRARSNPGVDRNQSPGSTIQTGRRTEPYVSGTPVLPDNASMGRMAAAAGAAGAAAQGAGSGGGGASSPQARMPGEAGNPVTAATSATPKNLTPGGSPARADKESERTLGEKKAGDTEKKIDGIEQKEVAATVASDRNVPGAGMRPGARGAGAEAGVAANKQASAAGSTKLAGIGGTGGGNLTTSENGKACNGDDCKTETSASRESKEGEAVATGGGAPGYSGTEAGKPEKGAKAEKELKGAGGKEEALTKFEAPKDRSKDFAALDAIFDAVAGKKSEGLAAALAPGTAEGPVDLVELAKEAAEPEMVKKKSKLIAEVRRVSRGVASAGDVMDDNFDGDLGLDISLFQRISECHHRAIERGTFAKP